MVGLLEKRVLDVSIVGIKAIKSSYIYGPFL